jgi:exonuclease V gamma subunit
MDVAGIENSLQLSLIERGRILPVNGREFYEKAREAVTPVSEKFASEFRNMTTVSCNVLLPCNRTLSGTIAIPADFEETRERHQIQFSKSSADKLLNFYLEQLLLTLHFKFPVTGKVIFTKEAPDVMAREFPPVANAAERLNKLLLTALHVYSKPAPLPIFSSASFECCKEKGDCVKGFKNDVLYHGVIERFYTENDFCTDRFKRLARRIYAPVAAIEGSPL